MAVYSLLVAAAGLIAPGLFALGGLSAWLNQPAPGEYFTTDDGVRIHYFVRGEGEPVILIHGLGVRGDLNWGVPGILGELAKNYKVIVYDNRGHGSSDKPTDPAKYGKEMVKDPVRLMDHLGIQKAHVVGYSMGGFITLKLLTMYPDRLLSAAPCGAGWEKPEGRNLAVLKGLQESLPAGHGYIPLVMTLEPKGAKASPLKMAAQNAMMRLMTDEPAILALIKSFPEFIVSEDELRKNQVPTLFIVGTDDPLCGGVEAAAKVMANAEAITLPGADHMAAPMRREFIQGLEAFLARHGSTAK